MTQPAIIVDGLWKKFRIYHEKNQYLKAAITKGKRAEFEDFWALRDVSFEVPIGQTFGIIGSNGSGKSTLLKCLAGILVPDKGNLAAEGRMAALLELGAGFHPDLSGRENVSLNGAILGMTRREIEKKFDGIVAFAGLEQFIDTPVKNYSSGMIVRLGFAVAINVEPEILIIDEVLAVGDEEFQQRCFQKIEQFRKDGRTIVFVSHGLSQVSQLCDVALWLDKGHVRTIGPSYQVVSEYLGESHQIRVPESHPIVVPNFEEDAEDEPAVVEIDKSRWGSGEVRIDSANFLDEFGNPTLNLESGKPVSIVIDYTVHRPVKELVVGLRISHLHGLTMWGSNTKRREHTIKVEGKTGRVLFEIESFPLLEGTFDLTVAVSDRTEVAAYDHRDNFVRFNVMQKGSFDEGTTRFNGTWSD
jgi:ABC-type polysaccharide/polyol phosphate transport system ATPase subunit